MTDNHREQTNGNWQDFDGAPDRGVRGSEEAELDRALDAALAKYAAVDPRPGLEERVLAHLRTAPEPRTWMIWKLWTAAGFAIVAIAIAVALTLAWRTNSQSHANLAIHSSAPAQHQPERENSVAINQLRGVHGFTHPRKTAPRRTQAHPEVAATADLPRLDQFPSAQPLSDQEKLLANYIAQDPKRAALLAELRMDALRRDAEEHRRLAREDPRQ